MRNSTSSKPSKRTVLATQIVTSLGLAAASAAGGLVARDMGFPHGTAMPLGMLVLGSGVSAPIVTSIMSRRGRASGLSIAYIVAAIGALIVLSATMSASLVLLLAGHLLMGFGNTAVMLTRFVVADLGSPHGRAESIGVSLAVIAVGATIGPALLGPAAAIALTLGLPGPAGLYVLAVPALVTGPLILRRDAPVTRAIERPLPRDVTHAIRRPVRASAGGVAVLGVANLTMVTLMAVAPAHLAEHGHGFERIGLVVSIHLAAMYLPSPLIGRLVDRRAPEPMVAVAACVLTLVSLCTALSAVDGLPGTAAVLFLLGLGWSAQTVAGSAMLTAGVRPAQRPRVEAMGEGAMSVGAAIGTMVLAGPLLAWGGIALLGTVIAVVNVAVVGWQVATLLGRRRPGPRMARSELAFVFTDVEGSTGLLRRIGDEYASVIHQLRNIIAATVHAHGGRVVDFEGDGAFALFGGARGAVAAAVEIQTRVRGHEWGSTGPVSIRVGVHKGKALVRNGEVIGYDVHCAARVAAAAEGGQIVVSAAARNELGTSISTNVVSLGRRSLKDIDEPVSLFEVLVPGLRRDGRGRSSHGPVAMAG